jgi:hypothetical protein
MDRSVLLSGDKSHSQSPFQSIGGDAFSSAGCAISPSVFPDDQLPVYGFHPVGLNDHNHFILAHGDTLEELILELGVVEIGWITSFAFIFTTTFISRRYTDIRACDYRVWEQCYNNYL